MQLHPCTETDVKSFKFVFFDSNKPKKDVLNRESMKINNFLPKLS